MSANRVGNWLIRRPGMEAASAPRKGLSKACHIIDKVDAALGPVLTGFFVGVMLFCIAASFSAPLLKTTDWGIQYEAMSVQPFDSDAGDVHLRILTPALAHVLHFRAHRYVYFPLLVGAILLAFAYVYARRQGMPPALSAGVAAAVAVSSPILSALAFAGYTDTTSYLMLLWAMMFINSWAWPTFILLAILNHESNLLCVPAFLFLFVATSTAPIRKKLLITCYLAVCIGLAFGVREYMAARSGTSLTSDYYLSLANVKKCIGSQWETMRIGVFHAFKALWVLPVIASFGPRLGKDIFYRIFIWMMILISLAQLLIAVDSSRLLAMAFPAILASCCILHRRWGAELLTRRLWALVACNAVMPSVVVIANYVIPRPSLLEIWIRNIVR